MHNLKSKVARYTLNLRLNNNQDAEISDYLATFEKGFPRSQALRLLTVVGFNSLIKFRGNNESWANALSENRLLEMLEHLENVDKSDTSWPTRQTQRQGREPSQNSNNLSGSMIIGKDEKRTEQAWDRKDEQRGYPSDMQSPHLDFRGIPKIIQPSPLTKPNSDFVSGSVPEEEQDSDKSDEAITSIDELLAQANSDDVSQDFESFSMESTAEPSVELEQAEDPLARLDSVFNRVSK